MADALLATVYPASGRAATVVQNSGTVSNSATTTEAGMHDASDTTKECLTAAGDGDAYTGDGTLRLEYQMGAFPDGVYSFLRYKMRAKHSGSAVGSESLQPSVDGVDAGTPEYALTGSFAEYAFDLAVDEHSAAWVKTHADAVKHGLLMAAATVDEFGTVVLWDTEFCIEVWGSLVSEGVPMEMEAEMPTGSATGVGEVASAGEPMDMELEMPAGVGVPGTTVVYAMPMEMEAEMVPPASADVVDGSFDPDVEVTQPTFPDGAVTPTVLRPGIAALSDQNLATGSSDVSVMDWPDTDTLIVDTGGFADSAIAGDGDISGLRFYAFCRAVLDGASASFSNARVQVTPTHSAVLTGVPSGLTPGPDAAQACTGLVATKDGTNPWTWATLKADLQGVSLRIDTAQTTPMDFVTWWVYEVWVEVCGPQGSHIEPVTVTQAMGRNVNLTLKCESGA